MSHARTVKTNMPVATVSLNGEQYKVPVQVENLINALDTRVKLLEAFLESATEAMPSTYYAGNPRSFRIKQMSDGFYRANSAINELEEFILRNCDPVDMTESDSNEYYRIHECQHPRNYT